MMRRSQREYKPSPVEQAGQRNWNEAYGFYRDRDRWKSIICLCALGLTAASFTRSWMHDSEPKMVPFVIDHNGPSLITARLEAKIPDAARIKGHLKEWVEGMRTVTFDGLAQQRMVDRTWASTDISAAANTQLTDWYTANMPPERAKKGIINVDVESVVSQGGESWLIDWKETLYPREANRMAQVSHWRMTATVNLNLPKTEDEILANWDGVFVTSFHVVALDRGV